MDLRVMIAVPSMGSWKSRTGMCIAETMEYFTASPFDQGSKIITISSATGSILPEVRHKLVASAFQWDATHILWVDSDMDFPRDALHKMIAHGKPVVAANYVRKSIPTVTTAYVENDSFTGPLVTKPADTGLVEVKHAGMGLMLTETRVLEALSMPMFMFEPQPPNNVRMMGEDVYFCRKLREAGVKIYVDQEVSNHVKHIGDFAYTVDLAVASTSARLASIRGKQNAAIKAAAE